ncbi:hypothetical protein [Rugosimonospora africana]|nr:hypothetical protein [Rugosimonospora africana]
MRIADDVPTGISVALARPGSRGCERVYDSSSRAHAAGATVSLDTG